MEDYEEERMFTCLTEEGEMHNFNKVDGFALYHDKGKSK